MQRHRKPKVKKLLRLPVQTAIAITLTKGEMLPRGGAIAFIFTIIDKQKRQEGTKTGDKQ